ncbi:trehalase domain-containing protein [Ditylenchus destructor]|uniref:Trehalase n=1 Tax=Ditylenchus destructor TaxID=166010 RepID=A0AAD4MTS5_9BILA|nr:trehalase domain-containing protein [Ditylenchus destructor]
MELPGNKVQVVTKVTNQLVAQAVNRSTRTIKLAVNLVIICALISYITVIIVHWEDSFVAELFTMHFIMIICLTFIPLVLTYFRFKNAYKECYSKEFLPTDILKYIDKQRRIFVIINICRSILFLGCLPEFPLYSFFRYTFNEALNECEAEPRTEQHFNRALAIMVLNSTVMLVLIIAFNAIVDLNVFRQKFGKLFNSGLCVRCGTTIEVDVTNLYCIYCRVCEKLRKEIEKAHFLPNPQQKALISSYMKPLKYAALLQHVCFLFVIVFFIYETITFTPLVLTYFRFKTAYRECYSTDPCRIDILKQIDKQRKIVVIINICRSILLFGFLPEFPFDWIIQYLSEDFDLDSDLTEQYIKMALVSMIVLGVLFFIFGTLGDLLVFWLLLGKVCRSEKKPNPCIRCGNTIEVDDTNLYSLYCRACEKLRKEVEKAHFLPNPQQKALIYSYTKPLKEFVLVCFVVAMLSYMFFYLTFFYNALTKLAGPELCPWCARRPIVKQLESDGQSKEDERRRQFKSCEECISRASQIVKRQARHLIWKRKAVPHSDITMQIPFPCLIIFAHIASIFCEGQPTNREVTDWKPPVDSYKLYKDHNNHHMCEPNETKIAPIFCYGDILIAVNKKFLYKDSKDFVDMSLKDSPDNVRKAFHKRFPNIKDVDQIDTDELKKFIASYFAPYDSELKNCTPSDHKQHPGKLMTIMDPYMRKWALRLNNLWIDLCREMKEEVKTKNERYSLIYVPNQFIVPGGRFREFYYWDTYWIIKGLIASEMYNMAKQMIDNLASMIEKFGFVPNGGRVYYLKRSQPPLLTPMLYEYYQSNQANQQDDKFLFKILELLDKEMHFWYTRRSTNYTDSATKKSHIVYQYRAESNVPRPESYKEDMRKAADFRENDEEGKIFLQQSIASAAEAGWDFSTRWFREGENISSIETINIFPVDLNAYMCWNFDLLSFLYGTLAKRAVGKEEQYRNKSEEYRRKKMDMMDTIEELFYNSTTGAWHDFNNRTKRHNTKFYASVAVPLFTNCYNGLNQDKARRLFKFMKDSEALKFSGGIPTGMQPSIEQWDFPNAWPPLVHMIIEGLRKSQVPEMQNEAFHLAKNWIHANYRAYLPDMHMWEKYDVTLNAGGKGGEYDAQKGFGWTNGVILDLLVTYNDRITWTAAEENLALTLKHNCYLGLIILTLWKLLLSHFLNYTF